MEVLIVSQGLEQSVVFKWWDEGWNDQTFVGIPLNRLMNEGLGPRCDAGFVTSPFKREDIVSYLFNNKGLEQFLKGFVGFISFTLSLEGGLRVVKIESGIPFNGFYNMLECLKVRVAEFLSGKVDFYESWTASLLVSRSPFPHMEQSSKVFIDGINQSMEKHFWNCLYNHRKSFSTTSTVIGIATAWSTSLAEACRRCLRTARNLSVEDKQFRTDLVREAFKGFETLDGDGL